MRGGVVFLEVVAGRRGLDNALLPHLGSGMSVSDGETEVRDG